MATGFNVLQKPAKQELSYEKLLQFQCNFCSSYFTNQDEQDNHIMGHFNQKYCTACDKLLIQIGSRWYEVKLHNDVECQANDVLDHNFDLHTESIKIEQIDLEPMEIPSELDETYAEDNYLSSNDLVKTENTGEPNIEQVKKESTNASSKSKTTPKKSKFGPQNSYICDYCEEEFNVKKDIVKHIRLSHSNKQDYFVCDICGKSFNNKGNLYVHKASHNDPTDIKCYICSEIFKDRFELKKHRTIVHDSMFMKYSEFSCQICNKEFEQKGALAKHKKNEHNIDKPYKCSECGEDFPSKISLNEHYSTHLDEGMYNCTLCDKKFQHKPTLIQHLNRIHAGFRPSRLKCDKCEKTFARRFELVNHRLVVHEGKRLFECETCGQNCINKQSLNVHKRSHLATKLFVCHLCGEGFNSEHILKRHIRTHSGMRPYPCNVCGKAFTRQEHLKRHMRIHTGERLYNCDVGDCSRSYVNAADLEQHKYTVHGIQFKHDGYFCPVCSKAYVQKSLLRKHMQSHV